MAEEILDDNIPQQEPTRKIPTPDEVLGKQPTTATRRVPTPDDVFGTVKKNTSSPSTNNSQSLDGSSTSQLEGNKQPSFDFNKTFVEIGPYVDYIGYGLSGSVISYGLKLTTFN